MEKKGILTQFVSETMLYGFANVFSRIFTILLIPLYTEYLSKPEYSNLIMLQSTFSLLCFLLALNSGVFFYYYEYENIKYRKIVFTSWFYYQVCMGLLLIFILLLFADHLVNLFIHADNLYTAIILMSIQMIPYIFNITNINFYRIDRKPKYVILIVGLEAFFTFGLVWAGLHYLQMKISGILAMQFFGRLLVCLLFLKKSFFYTNWNYFSTALLNKLVIFSWPFFITSSLSWVIVTIDKFIGVKLLHDKDEVALLVLTMQLVMPITLLAEMINMAIGPFVMSIRKNASATTYYQRIFDLSVFSAGTVLLLIVIFSPLLITIFANDSYMSVIKVIPLMALGSVFYLTSNQFAISFSLVKKTVFILYATLIGSAIAVIINIVFMPKFGFIIAGISQIVSYLSMNIFLYLCGKKLADLKIKIKNSLISVLVILLFIFIIYYNLQDILAGRYISLIIFGCLSFITIVYSYFYQQSISWKDLYSFVFNK